MLQVRMNCCTEYCERKPMNEQMILNKNSVLLVLILSLALKFLLRTIRKEVRMFITAFR